MKRIVYALLLIIMSSFIGGLPASLVFGEAGSQSADVTVSATPAFIISAPTPSYGDWGGDWEAPDLDIVPAFTPGSLVISPTEVDIGETVYVSLSVANTGHMAGSYKVTLKIDGVVEATQYVTVGAGASETVTFTILRDVAGSYSVDVNGLTGSFTVREKPVPAPPPPEVPPAPALAPELPPVAAKEVNWPLTGGVTGMVVIGVLTFFLRRRV